MVTTTLKDTSKVLNRRSVHYNTLDDLLKDVNTVFSGNFETVGNWTAGQILSHLATGLEVAVQGADFRAPLWLRLFARLMRKSFIQKPMKPGFKLSGKAAERFTPAENATVEEGLRRIREAIARAKTTQERPTHPFLGKLSKEDSDQFQLRHCELHMSFLLPAKN